MLNIYIISGAKLGVLNPFILINYIEKNGCANLLENWLKT